MNRIVCICGSTKWPEIHLHAAMEETFRGNIVLMAHCFGHADFPVGAAERTGNSSTAHHAKIELDKLHVKKIEMAHDILVVTRDGYIGDGLKNEVLYAFKLAKRVFLWDIYGSVRDCEYAPIVLTEGDFYVRCGETIQEPS